MNKEWLLVSKVLKKDIMTVGYLDLLGVSKTVMGSPIEEVAEKYINAYIAQTTSHLLHRGEEKIGKAAQVKYPKYPQFSDLISACSVQ